MKPGNAVAGAGKLAIPKFGSHPWTAIGAGVAMGVDDFDLTEENGVGLSPWPGDLLAGGVIPRRGHLESCAEFGNGIGGPHRVNQRIPSLRSLCSWLFLRCHAGGAGIRFPCGGGEFPGPDRPPRHHPSAPAPAAAVLPEGVGVQGAVAPGAKGGGRDAQIASNLFQAVATGQ